MKLGIRDSVSQIEFYVIAIVSVSQLNSMFNLTLEIRVKALTGRRASWRHST